MFGYENYKHRYTHMSASNKYKCTQTHSKFIWYGLLTYNKYISSNILLVILFIYLILFKKKEKRVKPGHLQQIKKKNYGSVIFCKASFIFNWKNFNTLWVIFFYLYINEVELFISHSLVTKTGMSDNQKREGCTSS